MLSEALIDRFVKVLLDEADRTARRAGLVVELNTCGILLAWESADHLHLRQLALNADVEWRVKYLLLNKLSQPQHLVLVRKRFLEALKQRTLPSALQVAS